jgi:hypothetical protein
VNRGAARRDDRGPRLPQLLRNVDPSLAERSVPTRSLPVAPEAEIHLGLPHANPLEAHVRQPRRQRGRDVEAASRGIGSEPEDGLQEMERRARGPSLRHVGAEVLHGKAPRPSLHAGVQLG